MALAVIGVGLLAASEVWVTSARRDKLAQLEWIGNQFTQAIGSYYESSPGGAKTYPSNLQEMLLDRRYATIRRHLRTVYANPFSGQQDWQLVLAADGNVRGVRVVVPEEAGGTTKTFVYQPGPN